jgi:hypothetical protein
MGKLLMLISGIIVGLWIGALICGGIFYVLVIIASRTVPG